VQCVVGGCCTYGKVGVEMRIAIMGYGLWACEAFRALQADGHTIVGVVPTSDERDAERQEYYRRLRAHGLYESLTDIARANGVQLLRPSDTDSDAFFRTLKALGTDMIVSCGWRRILSGRLLDTFICVNIHGALLPNYGGRMPVAWALLNGETETGVTVHLMTREIDAGPILCQKSFSISDTDAVADVLRKGMALYPELLKDAVRRVLADGIDGNCQDTYAGSYWPPLTSHDGRIDWKTSARDIYNLVRSQSSPYPGAYTYCRRRRLVVQKASLPPTNRRISPISGIVFGKCQDGALKVTTGDGYIVLTQVCENENVITPTLRIGLRLG